MLPQLVGMSCAICAERIGSEIDGRFCDACGNPIHDQCSKTPPGPATNEDVVSAGEASECPRCGSNPATTVSRVVREHRLLPPPTPEPTPLGKAAEQVESRKSASGICGTVGMGLLAVAVMLHLSDPGARPEDDTSVVEAILVVLGVLLTVGSLLLYRSMQFAEREYRRIGWEEDEEPPG
jgi:hypothetical protein